MLKEASTTIPIVMGLIPILLATDWLPAWRDLAGTLLDFRPFTRIKRQTTGALKEIVPKLSRVAVLGSSTLPGNAQT